MKKIGVTLGAILSSAALGGASFAADVKVGVVMGLSGPPAIVDFGESYLQGMKLALKDYSAAGKHKVEFIVYDDEANPQKAVSLVQRLLQSDKVPLIIGTVSSGNVLAFAPIVQKAGVPLIAGPAIASNITSQFIEEKPSFIFRCSMVEKFQIEGMLDWGVKTFKKIGLVHSTTGYGNFAAKEIADGVKARGASLVAVEAVAPNVSDLTPQMLKMKESGAELVLNFHESFELVFRPMSKIDYKPTIAGNWGLSSLKVRDIVGTKEIEGTVMGQALDLSLDAPKAFVARMEKEYGKEFRWPVLAALGYDAAQVALKALDTAKSMEPEAIRDALEAVDGIKAISATPAKPYGPKDHECLDREHVFLGVWKDGAVVRLKY
ncbi:MAG: ABC transporter substrate-binding protein [Bradyrhizobium sp.]|uniref:ABC transporter substrate-binding protein n=1 Tax=Bradyrhizobium sp. TaxID=376 RepID=UPI002731AE0D|nr:ABC transporter substrate-binding protein [Bradyrhizobium sp.]MDP1869573.1 ABC transporter substrate-binding protein [Bradyrhizobium sp.]